MEHRFDQQQAQEDKRDGQQYGYSWASIRPTHSLPEAVRKTKVRLERASEHFDLIIERWIAIYRKFEHGEATRAEVDAKRVAVDTTFRRLLKFEVAHRAAWQTWQLTKAAELTEWGGM